MTSGWGNKRLYLSDEERSADMLQAMPRQRVSMNRASPLILTNAWQAIPFAEGASPFDANSFPTPRFDYSNRLIKANPSTGFEQSYIISIDLGVALNVANTAMKLSIRFMVPRPAAQGGPYYFPLPESAGKIDLPDQVMPPGGSLHFDYIVYSSPLVRQYGAQVQLMAMTYQFTSSGLLGGLIGTLTNVLSGSQRPQLTDAVMNMYAF